MDDGFSTTVTRDGNATVISVTGEIDIARAGAYATRSNRTSDHNRRSSSISRG